MAKTSTIAVTGSVIGDGISESIGQVIAIQQVNPNAPGGVPVDFVLASGNNTVPVPTKSQGGLGWVMIVCPSGSTIAKTLKGVAGDTGLGFGPNDFVLWGIPPGVTQFVIGSAGVETVQIYWG